VAETLTVARDLTTFASGDARPVDVRAIERELATLWKSASETADPGGAGAVTRACVMNLVVLTGDSRERDEAAGTIADLTASHPSRAIVLEVGPEAPAVPAGGAPGGGVGDGARPAVAGSDVLESWISAHCHRPGPSSPQVCCEQITLRAGGSARRHAPPTVASLLVPDLPVFLWCPGDPPFGDPLFERLAAMADRVLVDSERCADPRAGLAALVERAAVPSGTAFQDLNWERLLDLREYIAQFFDPIELREYAGAIDRIEIAHATAAGGTANPAQALLLAGWLASRLRLRPEGSGWSLAGATGLALEARGAGGVVKIEIASRTASPGGAPGCAIRSLTLSASRAKIPARFHLRVSPDETCLETEVGMAGACPIPRRIRLAPESVTALLSRALDHRAQDPALAAALQIVAGIAGLR
jgi:glucose-6-phosphate dehydrogenase assembly protein OpcA